jgi:hypothetical protein
MLEAPDQHLPIGVALPGRRHPSGAALWRLDVRGAELPGLWVIRDRRFKPAEECGAQHNTPVLLGVDPTVILLANSSRASGNAGFASPRRLILPSFRPNDPRREFANSINSRVIKGHLGS